ncbi:Retrovirus-related Pol poly from transposon 297 [Paramuricea clavata]|uniref:Retrovirus-related Pol poly from transposon 297 n=1 Tax=Paramuricea clavata TaxID=317549 RepID=A0A7D9L3D0_PARCT|nr:Retrovirus-related Pol poly from transposon 297 [Paramuricea clavata]
MDSCERLLSLAPNAKLIIAGDINQLAIKTLLNYHSSIKLGIVPDSWKLANLLPVPKESPLTESNQLRPISLTNIIVRLFERAIYTTELVQVMENAIHKDQFAYKRGYSSTMALIKAQHTWMEWLDGNASMVSIVILNNKDRDLWEKITTDPNHALQVLLPPSRQLELRNRGHEYELPRVRTERENSGCGLEKFHYYAYGRHVTVETDHKPLEAIFKKHLSSAPPRISRMMLRIQKYVVEIKYVPGKEIPLADALSRLSPCDTGTIKGLDVSIHELHMHLNASPIRIQHIQTETAKDPVLNSLKSFISRGLPDKRSDCPSHLHGYWNYCDELTVANGLILKGTRIIIPKSLQPEVLEQLHYAHEGAEKCKLRAKGSVFWASINADIENMVKGCSPCQHNQRANVKEPLTPHDIPPKPWHTLCSDLGGFTEFSKAYGFEHVTTSPYYSQANGFIERNVQTVKNLLQKCKESESDPHLAMLCLRTTPINHHLPSSTEMLNSRTYQSNLSSLSKPTLFPKIDDEINAKLQARHDLQKIYYDKSSRDLPEDKEQTPKSYILDMPSGSTLKRNRRYIRPSVESPNEDVGDNPSTSITATESSFTSNTSVPTSPPKVEETRNVQTPKLRISTRVTKRPDRWNL